MATVASFLPILINFQNKNKDLFSKARQNLSSDLPTEEDRANFKSKKTNLQFVLISLIIFGIEICYAAETAFVSPILQKIGVPIEFMSMVWGLSPLIGFFVCPILGVLSDNCKLKMGRRRPFIINYSIGIIVGLFLIGYGSSLGNYFCDYNGVINSCIIVIVIMGVVLVDFNCDACQSPARAYLIDVCATEDQTLGLSTFTVMAGAGGCLGYVLGGIPWHELTSQNDLNEKLNSTIIDISYEMESSDQKHQQYLFTFVAVIYIISALISISSFKEIPLEDNVNELSATQNIKDNMNSSTSVENLSRQFSSSQDYSSQNSQQPIMELIISHFYTIIHMPIYLKWLCITHCFSWMSLLCFSLYFTDFVGEEIYEGSPNPNSEWHSVYNHGVRVGSLCMAIYSISCSFYSHFLRNLIKKFTTRYVYVFSQLTYSVGMLILAVTRSLYIAPFTAITAGIVYSSLFTIPFILIANYHTADISDRCHLLEEDTEETIVETTPERGLGTDLAIINSMVFVAQIIHSCFIGAFMKIFGSKVVVIYAATIFSTCAAISSRKLLYFD